MKRTWMAVVVAMVVAMVTVAQAYTWRPLSVPEMARWGATHSLEFDYADMVDSTETNTAETITIALPAKTAAEFRAIILDTAFDTGNTNYTGSVALTVGDGSDVDLYLTSTELASDGTEVFVKYAPVVSAAASVVTPTTAQLIFVSELAAATAADLTYDSDGSGTMLTNSVVTAQGAATLSTNTVVTAVALAAPVVTELGRKASTAAHNIVLTFTPNEEEALDENTSGKGRLFFRITDWK